MGGRPKNSHELKMSPSGPCSMITWNRLEPVFACCTKRSVSQENIRRNDLDSYGHRRTLTGMSDYPVAKMKEELRKWISSGGESVFKLFDGREVSVSVIDELLAQEEWKKLAALVGIRQPDPQSGDLEDLPQVVIKKIASITLSNRGAAIMERAEASKNWEANVRINAPITINELCQYLRISRTTVYRLISEANLPAHKLPFGIGYRFYPREVDAWVLRAEGAKNEGD